MERLTYRPKEPYISKLSGDLIEAYSDADIRDIINRLAAYEDTRLTPEQCENAKVIIESAFSDDTSKAERIRELLKADKDGRLVVLPCKVGQRVFALLDTDKHISECEVKQIGLGNEIGFVGIEPIGARGREYGVSIKGFGKTVFLTREAAEKELEEIRNGNGNL